MAQANSLTAEAFEPETFKARLNFQLPLFKNKSARYVYFFCQRRHDKKDPCFDNMLEIESLMTLNLLAKGDELRNIKNI